MLEAINLKKIYSGVTVLDLPSLKIQAGESFGLVGNNGAGKTTFFSLVLDLIQADLGEVRSKEKDVKGSEHWKQFTGSYLDESFLVSFLTPEEFFDFLADLHGLGPTEYERFTDRFEDFFAGEVLGKSKYIRDLSKGNQKKVGIAAALMSKPEVLILDEPFPNLDPSTVSRLKRLLRDLKADSKTTMLISSHNLNHVTEVCDRITILDKGMIVEDIQVDESTLEYLESYFEA